MEKNNLEECFIDIPSELLQEQAEQELGRLLTSEELTRVSEMVVDVAFGAIQESIQAIVASKEL
jgi:hypothetical protein